MTGLDTNILLRYFAQDDVAQSRRATQILEEELTHERPGYVSLVALLELVWVLDRSYGLPMAEVMSIISYMLRTDVLQIQNRTEVTRAHLAQLSGAMSFADALLGELNAGAGCDVTLTFDRRASRAFGFRLA